MSEQKQQEISVVMRQPGPDQVLVETPEQILLFMILTELQKLNAHFDTLCQDPEEQLRKKKKK